MNVIRFPEYAVTVDRYVSIPVYYSAAKEWKFEQEVVYNGIPQTWLSPVVSFDIMIVMCNITSEDALVLKLKYCIK